MVPNGSPNLLRTNPHVTWPRQARYLFKIRIGNRQVSVSNFNFDRVKRSKWVPTKHISKVFSKRSLCYMATASLLPIHMGIGNENFSATYSDLNR